MKRCFVRAPSFAFFSVLLLGMLGLMSPPFVSAQEMGGAGRGMGMILGMPHAEEEAVAIGSDGTIYLVASPRQGGMGPDLGRVVLLALDPTTFRVRWRYALEDEEVSVSRPVVSEEGTVYVTVFEMMEFGSPWDPERVWRNARLLAVQEGALKWSYEFESPFVSPPVLGPDGMIFVTTNAVEVQAMPGPWGFARFFALADRGTSAEVRARLDLGMGAVSAPVVGPHSTSQWAVYVTGEGMSMGPGMGLGTVLFVITPGFQVTEIRLR